MPTPLHARAWVYADTLFTWRHYQPPRPSAKFTAAQAERESMSAPPLEVRVSHADTLDAARAMCDDGRARLGPPLVLNMADLVRPGGMAAAGGGAQEEELFRRTNLCRHLAPELYPLAEDEAVYSPDVTVFRGGEAAHYAPLSPAWRVCLAEMHGHDALVLGALGCGAFGCPADHVADIFAARLRAFRLDGRRRSLKHVEFAVLGKANHAAFQRSFRDWDGGAATAAVAQLHEHEQEEEQGGGHHETQQQA